MRVAVWAPKGGSGASVVAAGTAVVAARIEPVRLLDCAGDLPAYFGLRDDELGATPSGAPAPHEVAPGVELVQSTLDRYAREFGFDDGNVVVDLGTEPEAESLDAFDQVLMVVRACYVALRRAVRHPVLRVTDGIVFVDEPGRALGARDVAAVLDLPVVASIPAVDTIARAADAGVLGYRCPDALTRPLRRLLAWDGHDRPAARW